MRRVLSGPLLINSPAGWLFSIVFGCGVLTTLGCSPRAAAPAVTPVQVSDAPATSVTSAEFPRVLSDILHTDDRSQKTKLLLAGVVQYQLTRAQGLFDKGLSEEAEDVVTGALLLLRHDDELLSATRNQALPLVQAGHAAARMGDAGRASALYQLALSTTNDAPLKAELTEHLAAIKAFNSSVTGSDALLSLGEQTRTALSQSVVYPSAPNYLLAKESIVSWMRGALSSAELDSETATAHQRDVALEAYRAVKTGAPAMVALNVRQGAPLAAVDALRQAGLERALPPAYISILESTVQDDSAEAWLTLFRQFEELRSEEPSELTLPRYVNDGAAFWAALGLYRHGGGRLEYAMPLAMTLVEFGIPEVASVVLAKNLGTSPRSDALVWSLTLVLRGLLELSRTDQLLAARRSYQAAQPLFDRAQTQLGETGPDPARAQGLMAALEVRHAHLAEARVLLLDAQRISREPHTSLRLGHIERHLGQRAKAESLYQEAVSLAQKNGDLLIESEAELAQFALLRDADQRDAAASALARSLTRALLLQRMAPSTATGPQIERHLAGILQYYAASQELHATYQRALEQSRTSLGELEMTLTDMARAALTLGDLRLGSSAATEAIKLGLAPENAIYIALWYQLLQRQLGQPSDGVSRQIFEQAGRARGWPGVLRRFGLGELSAEQLTAEAQSAVEKTEAAFYSLLMQTKPGDARFESELARIAQSDAIDLIEVRIAADLRDRARRAPAFHLPLPDGLELP